MSHHLAWMERRAGGSRSLGTVHQRVKDRRPWVARATDKAAKHHKNTINAQTFSTLFSLQIKFDRLQEQGLKDFTQSLSFTLHLGSKDHHFSCLRQIANFLVGALTFVPEVCLCNGMLDCCDM